MKELIFSGCSYSVAAYVEDVSELENTPHSFGGFLMEKFPNVSMKIIAKSGNSNIASIRSIYEYIKQNQTTDSTFLLQITHLHRIGGYWGFSNRWLNFQPMIFNLEEADYKNFVEDKNKLANSILDIDDDTENDFWNNGDSKIKKELLQYYQTWLKYKYDETFTFKDLIFQIDLLKSFLLLTGNKLKIIWWPKVKDSYLSELKNYNVFNIDGQYSMMDWSIDNKVIGLDTHLTIPGHDKLSKKLYKYLNLE